MTTAAPINDSTAAPSVYAALEAREIFPACHIVDTGYVDAALVAVSRSAYSIDRCGPVRESVGWPAHTDGAFDIGRFMVDWDQQRVTYRMAHPCLSWTPAIDHRANDLIKITCACGACRDCAERAYCIRHARRHPTSSPASSTPR
jgi:transposase